MSKPGLIEYRVKNFSALTKYVIVKDWWRAGLIPIGLSNPFCHKNCQNTKFFFTKFFYLKKTA
jgi:hypothetical protein